MNWYLLAVVFFIVSLHQVFAKSQQTAKALLKVKPTKPFDFTKHEGEEWPHWVRRFYHRHI